MSEKTQVLIIRALIILFILISVVIAIIQYNNNITFIAQLMGVSWGALAGSFLAPLLYGLYWKKTTKSCLLVQLYMGLRSHDNESPFQEFIP